MAVKLTPEQTSFIRDLRQSGLGREEIQKRFLEKFKRTVGARAVSRHGGVKADYLSRDQYAKLYPDLKKRLLSDDKKVSEGAYNTARRRQYVGTESGRDVVNKAQKNYRSNPRGQAYYANYKITPETRILKSTIAAERRANQRRATPFWAKLPQHSAETKGLYGFQRIFNDAYGNPIIDIDHRERLKEGGRHAPYNLQALTKDQHYYKSGLENQGRFDKARTLFQFNRYNLPPNVRGLLPETTTAFQNFFPENRRLNPPPVSEGGGDYKVKRSTPSGGGGIFGPGGGRWIKDKMGRRVWIIM